MPPSSWLGARSNRTASSSCSILRPASRAQTWRSDRCQQSQLGGLRPNASIGCAHGGGSRVHDSANSKRRRRERGPQTGHTPHVRRICELPDVGPIRDLPIAAAHWGIPRDSTRTSRRLRIGCRLSQLESRNWRIVRAVLGVMRGPGTPQLGVRHIVVQRGLRVDAPTNPTRGRFHSDSRGSIDSWPIAEKNFPRRCKNGQRTVSNKYGTSVLDA